MNLQHGHFEVINKVLKRLPFLLLDEKEKVRVLPRLLATLELGDELLAKLIIIADGVRWKPSVPSTGGIFEGD